MVQTYALIVAAGRGSRFGGALPKQYLPLGGQNVLRLAVSAFAGHPKIAGVKVVIRDEDRPTVRAISLQRWAGQFWSGQWEHQTYLAVPTTRSGKASSSEGAELEDDEDAVESDNGAKSKRK